MLHVPDGTVNVCSFNGRKQFYFYESGKRSYINERNRQLVHKLCQKDYDQRQKEVQPILLPDSEFIKQWENVTYEGKGFGKDAPEFYTEKGERVRSKTVYCTECPTAKRNSSGLRSKCTDLINS